MRACIFVMFYSRKLIFHFLLFPFNEMMSTKFIFLAHIDDILNLLSVYVVAVNIVRSINEI